VGTYGYMHTPQQPSLEIYVRRMERVVVAIVLALGNSVGASSSPIYKGNTKNDRPQLDASSSLGFAVTRMSAHEQREL